MKKFLALVMALAMVMSLTVVSTSAKDFTDDDSITYTEAIDVISALEIMDGYTDGSFQPNTQLNRGQAAKIICNLILGVAAADNLTATKAPFPDVPASHIFAGYISYCAQEGIISGYSDGYFRPGDTLSGYAFMKMLLGALGYDQTNEGLTGSNWTIQCAKLVQGIGLASDLDDDFIGSKTVTREEAALYALNTLQARTVEYVVPGGSISVNGIEINQKASNATYRVYDVRGNQGSTKDPGTIDTYGYIEFAEEHFPRLELVKGQRDDFRRPSHRWTYKGDKIGDYTDIPDATYEGTVTQADIYSDLNLTSTTTKFSLYIDGMYAENFYPWGDEDYTDDGPDYIEDLAQDADDPKVLKIDSNTISDSLLIGTGPGCTIECYKTPDRDGTGTIVVVNSYIGEVVSVNDAEGKRAANVEIAPVGDDVNLAVYNGIMGTGFLAGDDYQDTFNTEKFEVGDIVTFNYAFGTDGTSAKVKSVAVAESVEGEVKDYTDLESFTLDSTEYEYSKMATQKVDSNDIGTNVVVYLDKQGNALYFTEGTDNNKNYALVLDAGNRSAVGGSSFEAELLFADGTTRLVTTDKRYGATNYNTETPADGDGGEDTICLIGEWVTYREDSRGRYVLTKPSVETDETKNNMMDNDTHLPVLLADGYELADGDDNIGSSASESASRLKIDGNTARVNSSTVIIVRTKDDSFKVYTGVKNMPEIKQEADGTILYSFMTRKGQTYARFVYVDARDEDIKVINRNNTDLFLVGNENAKRSDDGTDIYYNFRGVVDGDIKTNIKLKWSDPDTREVIDILMGGKGSEVLLRTYFVENGKYEVSKDDRVENDDSTGAEFYSGETVDRVTAEAITINGDSWALAENCNFFMVDGSATNARIVGKTWNSIRTDTTGTRYAYIGLSLNRDYEVTAVYFRVN